MALKNAAGTTLTKSALTSASTSTPGPAVITITQDVYETYGYDGAPATRKDLRRLKFYAGQKVSQAEFDAAFAQPTVDVVAPNNGALAGGTRVVITGTNLSETTAVTIGGTAATALSIISHTKVECTAPAGTAGAKPVVLTTPSGSVTKANAFTYV